MHHSAIRVADCSASPTSLLQLAAVALGVWMAMPLAGQCTTQWIGDGVFGLDGPAVASTIWDPDGSGPLGPKVVVAGSFQRAGAVLANGVASYDMATQQWSDLAVGVPVTALAASATGSLYAAYGSVVALRIGSTWVALGSGMNGPVNAITALPNGEVFAAGAFTLAGSTPANGFARWNGTAWQSTGLAVPAVGKCLHVLANGEVLASGTFQISGNSAEHVARWNGTFWTMLGPAMNGSVRALVETSTGDLVAGGDFTPPGGFPLLHVVRWDGSAWVAVGNGLSPPIAFGTVLSMAPLTNGGILVGGTFLVGARYLARWDGTYWQAVDGGVDAPVRTVCRVAGDDFVAGGDFTYSGSRLTKRLALHTAAGWSTVPPTTPTPTLPAPIYSLLVTRDGGLVAGGLFSGPAGVNNVANWDGAAWQPMGGGVNGSVNALVEMPDDDIVAVGSFTMAGGSLAAYVARWDGSAWHAMGTGATGPVKAAVVHEGSAVIGNDVGVARWINGSWQQLGSLTYVDALASTSDGTLYASTVLLPWVPLGRVWRWTGSSWLTIGNMTGPVRALAEGPTGELVAAGSFAQVNAQTLFDIARWDGTAWQPFGPGQSAGFPPAGITAMTSNPLVVGGSFQNTPSGSGARLARWNGTAWQSIGTPSGDVTTLAIGPNGLFVGGSFTSIAGQPATNIAEFRTTCPATSVETGPGCAGSGGLLRTSLPAPWLGGVHRSRTTGFGNPALAFALWGFSNPNLVLATLHPLGGQGCGIYAEDDVVLLLVPFAGEAVTTLTVPNSTAFAGVVLHHQVVQFEFDGSGAPTGIQSGNGLRVQIGGL